MVIHDVRFDRKYLNRHFQIQEHENWKLLSEARIKQEEYLDKVREEDIKRKNKYRQELQDQMIYQEQMRRFKYDEFLQEKKFIDDLVQRIHEEDER